jgi:hypothetical protein
VWHGSVMEGITLWPDKVYAPRAISALSVGQCAAEIASGRTPSSMNKSTVMMVTDNPVRV